MQPRALSHPGVPRVPLTAGAQNIPRKACPAEGRRATALLQGAWPGVLLCEQWPTAGSWPYLTLIQWGVLGFPEDHAEGDTLGIGGEDPADGEACLGHGDGDEAVGTGPHKQLPVGLPEVGDFVHCEG